MKIVIAADHGGFQLKGVIGRWLESKGHEVFDEGCDSTDSVDYPDYAQMAAVKIVEGTAECGILVCGTGIGMSIAANRHMAIRAAVCFDENTAVLSREHNNANILCLGARVLTEEKALSMVEIWLETEFAGGRHQVRVSKYSR